ncbi:hypothetical protein [Lactobacillus terrae]|uniref:hypothetical protein n=1 Tax=Lactobacillus terrae TaxID=2269374 RepID=UPI000C1B7846|nr:hypothetical protein [Lactobacillus terrae]
MSKLFINDEECTDGFNVKDKLTFKDYMGGSTNKAMLKDDNGDVLDEKEFSLKIPASRWFLWSGKLDGEVMDLRVEAELKDTTEGTVSYSKDIQAGQLSFARAKYAAPKGTVIPEEDIDTFINYFVNEDGEPTEKLLSLKPGIEVFIDDVAYIQNSLISKNGTPVIQIDAVTPAQLEGHEGAGIAIGVTQKVVIKQAATEDVPEPQDYTINLKWI